LRPAQTTTASMPTPQTSPPLTSTAVPLAASHPAGLRRMVCADSLSVVREPVPKERTQVLASLHPGDAFYVQGVKGRSWAYGVAEGSSNARGWVLNAWLRPSC
jgi:hypothetical protein